MKPIVVAASILALDEAGANWMQIDIMGGRFAIHTKATAS
jgi:hypothetical protein